MKTRGQVRSECLTCTFRTRLSGTGGGGGGGPREWDFPFYPQSKRIFSCDKKTRKNAIEDGSHFNINIFLIFTLYKHKINIKKILNKNKKERKKEETTFAHKL